MKFYVTGRSSNYDLVQETFNFLKQKGHEITFEWTALPMVKPYAEHVVEAGKYAREGIEGVTKADVYIIFTHSDGNGVFTEFGAALASRTILGAPKIYAIGRENQSAAMFNYHDEVHWCDSLEEVFKEVGV